MARLIDADALSSAMYHQAFETNTDMARWDSGLWVRYKMFENARDNAPTIDAVPVVRCKDCKHNWDLTVNKGVMNPKCQFIRYERTGDFFCASGERRADG